MRFNKLDDWLSWQESLNPKEIDLGLDRIANVLSRAGLSTSFACPLIMVAGTNGKGSVVAILETIARAAGLKVCSYTSPHLFKYNERIKIAGNSVNDAVLCDAFDHIDQARGDNALTYFEFGTLAAIDIFSRAQADLVILEVGLGGRLDAVNIMQPDVSILTSVAIDHIDWLGDNRESIGFEKAGIFRADKPVICGDMNPPQTVLDIAKQLQCEFLLLGRDFSVDAQDDQLGNQSNDLWHLKSDYGDIDNLPQPALTGEFQKSNAATAIVAMQVLQAKGLLALSSQLQLSFQQVLDSALNQLQLAGRYQKIHKQPDVYLDVAHNLQAATALSSQLHMTRSQSNGDQATGNTWAIVAMLEDKDCVSVIDAVASEVDHWCLAGLTGISRGMQVQAFAEKLTACSCGIINTGLTADALHELAANQCTILSQTVCLATTVDKACEQVLSKADNNDRIIIFGSFYTVARAAKYFSASNDATPEFIN